MALDLPSLLREKHIDCDNYAALTGYFANILSPGRENDLIIIGLDGGSVGNHAQVFFRISHNREILADPTVGIYAEEGFNDLLSGKPLATDKIAVMHMHKDVAIDAFGNRVYTALAEGRYRPSDLLYYFHGLDAFLRFSKAVDPYFIKGSVSQIVSHYPTPASDALRKNLDASLH